MKCVSCAGGGSELNGVVGGNTTIRYIFKSPFTSIKISYNGTRNEIVINSFKINTAGVTDKRFIIPNKTSGTGNRSIDITLTKLSINDNGVKFDYVYTNTDAQATKANNILIVYGRYLINNKV